MLLAIMFIPYHGVLLRRTRGRRNLLVLGRGDTCASQEKKKKKSRCFSCVDIDFLFGLAARKLKLYA